MPTGEKVILPLVDYKPKPKLVVTRTQVDQPRFQVIDVHNHLGEAYGGGWDRRPTRELLDVLDEAGVQMLVDLDGGWGETLLEQHLDKFKSAAPERFQIFGGVDWNRWPVEKKRFGELAARRFEAQVRRGAQGLKIWKNLGLSVLDHSGSLAAVDDPGLIPIWQKAGELKVPVVIHVADPAAFFDPVNEYNERYEELLHNPDWSYHGPQFPPLESLLGGLERLVSRHPATTFIGAHVGCYAENLGWVGGMLERYPNFHIDISARIAELGRQPYTARRFFLNFSDRIMFGLDQAPQTEAYRIFYRFLETGDEYFAYGRSEIPSQGRWQIYGIHLPDDVLEMVYWLNAARVLQK